jgi:hypothetical protein
VDENTIRRAAIVTDERAKARRPALRHNVGYFLHCIVRLHRLQDGFESSITLTPRCSELLSLYAILEKLGPRPGL